MDPYQYYEQRQQNAPLGINPRIRSTSAIPLAGNIDLGPAIEGPVSGGTRRTMRVPESMEDIANMYRQAQAGLRETVLQPGGLFKNREGAYRGAAGGKSSAALGALQTAMQDPIAGVGSLVPGLVAGGAANMLTTAMTQGLMAGPPQAKAAGMALRYLVPAFVGGGVQQASARAIQGVTGSGPSVDAGGGLQAAGGGLFGLGGPLEEAKIPLPWGGSIALGERTKLERQAEFNRQQRKLDQQQQFELLEQQSRLQMRNDLEYARATAQLNNQSMINQMNAMAPIIERAQRNEAAIDQARLNTQGAIYQRLGRMSGMFQLAGQGMAESGALARTMIANSPYNAAILPAPQISFGN